MKKDTSILRKNHFEIIKALIIGEESGFVGNFDAKEHLKDLHHKYLLLKTFK